jgi:hypothetical protein
MMMGFIELHGSKTGLKYFVNIDHIVCFHASGEGSMLIVNTGTDRGNNAYHVMETSDRVAELVGEIYDNYEE